jgi:hypothetical protein
MTVQYYIQYDEQRRRLNNWMREDEMVWSSYGRPLLKSPQAVKMQPAPRSQSVSQSGSQSKQPSTTIDLRLSTIWASSTLFWFWFVCSRPQTSLFGLPYRILVTVRSYLSYSFLLLCSHAACSLLPGPDPFVQLWFRRCHWFHSGWTLVLRPASSVACR